MRILRKFVKLTKRTYPYGTETLLRDHLPSGYKIDNWGNYYIRIGGDKTTTMFTCHLDTASYDVRKVKHVFDGKMIKTDGTSILGADDKAGMVILLYMIEKKVPGLYYFFIGEERGCIGSGLLSGNFKLLYPNVNKIISFDRRGTTSVITHQMSRRSCSDEFANALSTKLNEVEDSFRYVKDSTGVYTDSAEFIDIVSECTNISVGYQNEHTTSEVQNIEHLRKLCGACAKIDWESLPSNRVPGTYDYDSDYEEYYGYGRVEYYDNYLDDDYDYKEENYSWINYDGNGLKKVYVSQTRINQEKELIHGMLKLQGYSPGRIIWDGNSCYIQECADGVMYVGSRTELIEFIPELAEIPSYHFKYKLGSK